MSTGGGFGTPPTSQRRRGRGRGRGRGSGIPPPGSQHQSSPPSPASSSPMTSLLNASRPPAIVLSPMPVFGSNPGPRGQVVGFLASLNDDTDLTIKLDGHTWKVHSNMMIARSPFFEAICNGQWKESEAHIVELHDDNPRIFARLLQFIYCDDYEGNMLTISTSDARMYLTVKKLLGTKKATKPMVALSDLDDICNERIIHFQVYELADKYGCQDLQDLARKNIGRVCGAQEIDHLRAMICHQPLDAWRELIDKDERLKNMFAEKLAANYKTLKFWRATEQGTEVQPSTKGPMSISLKEWMRWMEEDNAFCMMVVDAMSEKLP